MDSPHKLKPIEEQVVVIFGASSGMGREAAIQFARRGAKVVVASRDAEALSTLVDSIGRAGGTAVSIVADAGEFQQVQAVAQKAVDAFGRLDTWVQTVGVSIYATLEETTPEEFKRVIEVNLLGQAYGAMAALPHLRREGRGALIHVSSVEAYCALPYQSAYAASKHGVMGFLDSLRLELRKEGVPISVTNVMPAGINTPLFSQARSKFGVKPMPVPPIYKPEHAAEILLYAAENPTRDITVGGAAKLFILGQRISPKLVEEFLLRTGFRGQKTSEPKDPGAADNLLQPVGERRVAGDFIQKTRVSSMGVWLETHPAIQRSLKFACLGAAVLWLVRKR